MKRIKLIIEYDGTHYAGWQVQPNDPSVQESIETALKALTGEDIRIHGAGRTDAGVHALGQTAHFDTESTVPPVNIAMALNTYLPPDIRAIDSCEVSKDFHARYSAIGKVYRYTLYNSRVASAIHRDFTFSVKEALDIDAMRKAAAAFIGTHDFSAFCAANTSVEDKVRTITRINIENKTPLIEITVVGNGFLYNMVRIMTGALIEAGRGKIVPEDIKKMIDGKDRTKVPFTAPPQGLTLVEVVYSDATTVEKKE